MDSEPDSFTVDMKRFSHLATKDAIQNPRITLQRNFSRKWSQSGGQKQMNSNANNESDSGSLVPNSSSPRAALVGASMLEKPIVVTVGPTNHSLNQQIHHQITITSPATTTTATTTTATTNTAESKLGGKRFSFKRSSSSWTINPRRILFFFATMSSMGTILLIYFTLSMARLSEDDSSLN